MSVVSTPGVQRFAGVSETFENLVVEAFIAQLAVERLHQPGLLGLARRDLGLPHLDSELCRLPATSSSK